MDTIVYSIVTSDYDMTFTPKIFTDNVNYILFSDITSKIKGWQIEPIAKKIEYAKSLTNRWYKLFSYELFPENDYSIYVDGNIRILGNLIPLLQEFKASKTALGVFKHSGRNSICQERTACIELGKFDASDLAHSENQVNAYLEEGMPYDQQLTENGIIFRWHRHPKIKEAMTLWWNQLLLYTKRDQMSLPYVVWKCDLDVKVWDWTYKDTNPYFEVYSHRGSILENLKIILYVNRNDSRLAHFIYSLKSIKIRLLNQINSSS